MAKYEVWILLFIAYIGSSETTSSSDVKAPQNLHSPSMSNPVDASHLSASPRVDVYETGNSIPPLLQVAPNSAFKREYRYMDDDSRSEQDWFGFNQFISRSARNLPFGTDRRSRTASLLGESTQIYPMATIFPGPPFHFDQSFVFNPRMNDLQSLGTVHHHDPFLHPRFIMMDHSMKFPRGILIPIIRPQQQPFNNKHQRSFNHQPTSRSHLQPAANAPTPVTLKIIPLKLTSTDLANALKSMSWMPIPINLLKTNGNQNRKEGNGHQQQTYSDKRHSMFDDDDESDLPPPSSHVATPPLGITYAEGRRSERYAKKFVPRL